MAAHRGEAEEFQSSNERGETTNVHTVQNEGGPQLKDLVLLKVPPNKWYILGLQLDIIEYDLDVIRMNNPNDDETCTMQMFKQWLKSTSNPSYAGLLEALYRIEETSLAAQVLSLWSGSSALRSSVIDTRKLTMDVQIIFEDEPPPPKDQLGPECVMDKFLQYFQNGKLWYSEGFYTHFGGYKLCLEVNAASIGKWAGRDISVGLHLMKGDFDDVLSFPFYGEITVQLVNRDNHITKVFVFNDKTTKAGARADQNMNKESCNILDFVSVKDIKQKFLRNNSIVFRVINVSVKEKVEERDIQRKDGGAITCKKLATAQGSHDSQYSATDRRKSIMDKHIIFVEKPPKDLVDQLGGIIRYDELSQRRVNSLKVHCKSGSWTGQLGDLNKHLNSDCSYAMVECPDLCGQKAQRGKMEAHKVKDCSKRPFICPYCSLTSTYEDITKNHLPQCEEEVVPCPNNCGDVTIKHKQLKEHIDQCPHTTVKCEYSFVGCTYNSTRQLINTHMESHNKDHQKMALKFVQDNESTIKSLTEKCKLLKMKYSLTYSIPEITTKNIWDSEAWSSEPFYTHLGGYKMLVTISGYHPEKTQLEIGVRVMIGEFDDELKVPFMGTIALQLVDHSELLGHQEMKYRLNQHESYSQKPFISYEELTSLEYQFLKANKITLRVVGIEVERDPHCEEVQPTVVPQEELASLLEQCKEKHKQVEILQQQNALLQGIGSRSSLRCIYAKYPECVMDNFLHYFQNGNIWYSEGFYTHFGGYKLCLEVNAAGTGKWAGKCISIGLHLMKGDFDDVLSFPFYGEITVQLVNRDNLITKVFVFNDKTLKAGARADQNMNKESCDIHDFVSVADIKQRFLRYNSIDIRVVNITIKEKKKVEEEKREEEPSSSITNKKEEDLSTEKGAIEGLVIVQDTQEDCNIPDVIKDVCCDMYTIQLSENGCILKDDCCDMYTIQLSENGCILKDDRHGFSIDFPSGILLPNQSITLTIGVMVYGPFMFPDGLRPISPILWICGDTNMDHLKLRKDAKVTLPHYLDIDEQADKDFEILFMKAAMNHYHIFNNKKQKYRFESMGNATLLNDHKAAFVTNHFCSLCLAANTSESIKDKIEYWMTVFIDTSNRMYTFIISYYLEACIETLNKHLNPVNKKKTNFIFKCKSSSLTMECSDVPQWILCLLKGNKISLADLDIWNKDIDILKRKEKDEVYFPRFELQFDPVNAGTQNSKVLISFSEIEHKIELPLLVNNTPQASPPPSPSPQYPGLQDKPTLPLLLKFTVKGGAAINIIQEINDYFTFGILLLNDNKGNKMKALKNEHHLNAEVITMEIFQTWFQGSGRIPVTWSTLVTAFRDVNLNDLANRIEATCILQAQTVPQVQQPQPVLQPQSEQPVLPVFKDAPAPPQISFVWKVLNYCNIL